MLPEIAESNTGGFSGEDLADHFGAPEVGQEPDNPARPKE
jgi:hypothetical protein